MNTYVGKRENVTRSPGTRVALASIVSAFPEGQSTEAIAQAFPRQAIRAGP